MRIGEVNKDNYKDFLRILGVKEPKDLDKLTGKAIEDEFDHSREAMEKYQISMGYAEEGMFVYEGDDSWKKIVDVPDSVKQRIIEKLREHIVANGNGTGTAEQGDEINAIAKEYWMTLPPSQRLSASWTLQKIQGAEGTRIMDYVRSQIPGWKPGQSFDTRILTDSNFGLGAGHLDMRV